MNRAGTGPSPLVLFPVSMICISALFILFSLSPFKIPSNQTLPVDEGCDLFNGRWLPDMRGSAYANWTCPTIPTSKNCFLNRREDRDFVNWRWKSEGLFLRIMGNKKLAFVSDSVARNHMESLLCLLQ
uniref:Trichome birefringence-like N-terminal domain-containing protein n=1 Tax=Kalanchoe fedtschenkoi TaxID=63787 RepID=A0A7N0VC50_KALFE